MNSEGFIAAFVERFAAAARTGGASELDVATFRALLIDHRDIETIELARRVQVLEQKLADLSPGERCAAICARLGIGKSHFYELREIPLTERKSAG